MPLGELAPLPLFAGNCLQATLSERNSQQPTLYQGADRNNLWSLLGVLLIAGAAGIAVRKRRPPGRTTRGPLHSTGHLLLLSVINLSSSIASLLALFALKPLHQQIIHLLLSVEAAYVLLDSARLLFIILPGSGQGIDLLAHHVATLAAVYTVDVVRLPTDALLRVLCGVNLSGFLVAFARLQQERCGGRSSLRVFASAGVLVGRLVVPLVDVAPKVFRQYKDAAGAPTRLTSSKTLALECFVHAFLSLLVLNSFYCCCLFWRRTANQPAAGNGAREVAYVSDVTL